MEVVRAENVQNQFDVNSDYVEKCATTKIWSFDNNSGKSSFSQISKIIVHSKNVKEMCS